MSTVADHLAGYTQRTQRDKMPAVTPSFWIAAVLGTMLAHGTVSWLTTTIGMLPVVTAAGLTLTLGVLTGLRLRAKRAAGAWYWTVFVTVAVAGIVYARVLTDVLAAPLPTATLVLALLMVAVLGAWRADEGAISHQSVTTGCGELSYWSTWIVTAAFGAVVGEWLLVGAQWDSAAMVAMGAALVLAVLAGRMIGVGAVVCFWVGAVAIGPLGASVADWLTSSPARGGVGFGAGAAGLLCLAGFVSAVSFSIGRSSPRGAAEETTTSETTRSARRHRDAGVGAAATAVILVSLLLVGSNTPGGGLPFATAAHPAATSADAAAARPSAHFTEATVASYRALTRDALTMVQACRSAAAQAQVTTLHDHWTVDREALRALDPAGWAVLDARVASVVSAMGMVDPAIDVQSEALTALLEALR